MQKFKDLQYVRPDFETIMSETKEYAKALAQAATFEEANGIFLKQQEKAKALSTQYTIASIRSTIDTNDEFYSAEMEYMHEQLPKLELIEKEANRILIESKFRKQFEETYGSLFIKDMEVSMRMSSEETIENSIEEAKLKQEYSKTAASCKTDFRGEECNFYGLLKHMQSTDRTERKEAFESWAKLYEQAAPKLDEIYDKLIAVRIDKAKKLGYDFIDMTYLTRGRYDYTKEELANFRKQIKEVVVPIASQLYEEQRKRLGIDTLYFYDEPLVFPEGNAKPIGTTEELVAKAKKMYGEMSPETKEYFDFMCENELFDLESKQGKRLGGYCTFLPSYGAPFIFSNFNGTSADVDVLTHEAGHAFEAYTAAKEVPIDSMIWSSSEINEIHSMSMEYFAYPWMELFFEDKADDYRFAHRTSAIAKLPYLVAVDEFQHKVYENPQMTAKERRSVWHQIEKEFMPWRNYDGNEFLEEGGFWMQKQHIFLYPFYYVEYAMSQLGAMEYFGRMKVDRQKAWADYLNLCRAGGSKGYFELLKIGNLSNLFEDGAIKRIVGDGPFGL